LYGYHNYLVPKSVVYHKYNYNRNNKKYYLLEVSRLICIIKYYRLKTIILLLPAFFIMEAGVIFLSIKEKWFTDKIKSYVYIIKNLKRLIVKRRRIQKNRVRTDREILQYFKGEIAFKGLNSKCLRWVNPFFKTYWRVIKKMVDFW
jgi:GT2 family glycosyltransferase